jgi:large subunit ribosomal protein L10
MKRDQKHTVVEDLTARLKAAETVLVADYRGLTMPQIDTLRSRLLESGAKFTVTKNTLTRRAAEAAGADALLALLEGPTAIAFIEADGDMVAAAKALADSARETKVLAIRGGVMSGRAMTAAEVESLATLPPADVLRGQVLGAIIAPLSAFAALLNAPLQNLIGLIDARIEQLEKDGPAAEAAPAEEPAAEEPAAEAETPAAEEEPVAEEAPSDSDTQADSTESAAEESDDAEPESVEDVVEESAEAPEPTAETEEENA